MKFLYWLWYLIRKLFVSKCPLCKKEKIETKLEQWPGTILLIDRYYCQECGYKWWS